MKIMFVCTGNTCRSPMAEYILKNLLKQENITDVTVKSSGLRAETGCLISENSRKALNELGIKYCSRKAQQFKLEYLNTYDYIITMTESQKRALPPSGKIYTLNDLTGCGDVTDPYMCSLPVYKDVSLQLLKAFKTLIRKGFFRK